MEATLTEQRRVQEDAFRSVNCFTVGRGWTVPQQQAPANYVPAAAVIRRGRALSGIIGRKAREGGHLSGELQLLAQPGKCFPDWMTRERKRDMELQVEQ